MEREVNYNLSFIWLVGGLRPDHKTIAEFRRRHKKTLHNVLKQCARMCLKLNLIAGNTLFVDGTKIRANAGWKNQWTKKRAHKILAKIDNRINALLTECETADASESGSESFVKMDKELKEQKKLQAKVQDILSQLKTEDAAYNTVDPECRPMHSTKGSFPSYTAQHVVDDKHGLIVHSDAVSDATDIYQFANQIDQANQNLEKPCAIACADAGYANTEETNKIPRSKLPPTGDDIFLFGISSVSGILFRAEKHILCASSPQQAAGYSRQRNKIDIQKIEVIVPTKIQAQDQEEGRFAKSKFTYHADRNEYHCPEGYSLTYLSYDSVSHKHVYRIHAKEICLDCKHFGVCTKSRNGRRIKRLFLDEVKTKLEKKYGSPEGQAIYKLRKQNAEHPFGHLRRNLGVQYFLMRGREGVKAETSILATCFNLARMITIIGVPTLLEYLLKTNLAGA